MVAFLTPAAEVVQPNNRSDRLVLFSLDQDEITALLADSSESLYSAASPRTINTNDRGGGGNWL